MRLIADTGSSAGDILGLIRARAAATRNELAEQTRLARSTVAQRLAVLAEAGLVRESGDAQSSGGRPAVVLAFNEDAGVVLVGDLGQTGCQLAVCDLACRVLAEHSAALSIAQGPAAVLGWVLERFAELLASVGRRPDEVFGIGIGVPGPVEFATGRPVSPPAMPGWDGESVPDHFAADYECPVLVDNDVRIMALGEHRAARPQDAHLLFVKVGAGIGAGVVLAGEIHRGERGAAGDIGHVVVAGHDDVVCACGNTGCLDAVASGWAITRRLKAVGVDVAGPPDVVTLVHDGHAGAVQEVRATGRLVGEAVASSVNLLNPTAVVIGGNLAQADEQMLAAVREVVYRQSTPLATRHLDIAPSRLGPKAGIIGAAHMVVDHVFAPRMVDARLA